METGEATPRGRFWVGSVRAIETTRVSSYRNDWKLKRVSGRDLKQGKDAGRLSREAEFVPAAWREQLKRVSLGLVSGSDIRV